jgi:cytidylate kinase
MSYDLIQYFNRRFANIDKVEVKPDMKTPGPFVTISRETGCNANLIAEELVNILKKDDFRWKYINKELIYQAANKLKVNPKRIHEIIEAEHRTSANEILDALATRYYKNDRIVRKNLTEILKYDATQGHVIIVGRGGVAVTKDIERGLHIKLVAPLDYRIEKIMERKKMTVDQAKEYVIETDKKRALLLEQFSGKKINQIYFDLTLNCQSFDSKGIVDVILKAMKIKHLV